MSRFIPYGAKFFSSGRNGSTFSPFVVSGVGYYPAYVKDLKANGEGGGPFNSGAWRTRDLTTIESDESSLVSIASNQLTLVGGISYMIEGFCPAFRVNENQTRVYDITNGAVAAVGASAFCGSGFSYASMSPFQAILTPLATTTYEIQHRATSTYTANDWGMGIDYFFDPNTEEYTNLIITRVS